MNTPHPTPTLGKYEILEEAGRGGFATVYRARDTVLRRPVALKILHPPLAADPDFVARFENDARAAAQLDHPAIVSIYEMSHLEGRLCIAMPFLTGGTLGDRIAAAPLPLAEAARVLSQIATALDFAHAAGFIHRDVKPSNVLFNARGQAVLTDFGLVKAVEQSVIARSTVGGVVGTPAYIAPEVWEGRAPTPQTDVYALGCVLFEMLVGEPLFKGGSSPAVMLAHFQPLRFPATWPPGVPTAIEPLLRRALARDPTERFASAGALATALQGLAASASDPLDEPYRALRAALGDERWQEAQALAQRLLAKAPDYRDVQELARQAHEGMAQAERVRWAAQWRAQALAAADEGSVEAARVAAQRWLDMAPDDAEARALLDRLAAPPTKQALAPTPTPGGADAPEVKEPGEASPPTPEQVAPDPLEGPEQAQEDLWATDPASGSLKSALGLRAGYDGDDEVFAGAPTEGVFTSTPAAPPRPSSPRDRLTGRRLMGIGLAFALLLALVVAAVALRSLPETASAPTPTRGTSPTLTAAQATPASEGLATVDGGTISQIVLTSHLEPDNAPSPGAATSSFASNQSIHLTSLVESAPAGSKASVHWLRDGEIIHTEVAEASTDITNEWVAFLLPAEFMQPGSYTVELYVNFKFVKAREFTVE